MFFYNTVLYCHHEPYASHHSHHTIPMRGSQLVGTANWWYGQGLYPYHTVYGHSHIWHSWQPYTTANLKVPSSTSQNQLTIPLPLILHRCIFLILPPWVLTTNTGPVDAWSWLYIRKTHFLIENAWHSLKVFKITLSCSSYFQAAQAMRCMRCIDAIDTAWSIWCYLTLWKQLADSECP